MPLDINSLLNPEKAVNRETEALMMFTGIFDEFRKTFPRHSQREGELAYMADVTMHVFDAFKKFTDDYLTKERLESTGHNLVDQAYRANGFNDMGILEFAKTQHKMLNNMKEEINSSAGNLKTIRDRAAPPHQNRYLPEYRQHPMASDSSSRSSFSVLGSSSTTGFSAVGSQASFSDSSRTYHPSDGDRRSTSPPSPHDEDEEEDDDVLDADDSDERNPNRVDMDSLRHRGKGEYRCPYWRTCQKGGQNINGGPKIFHRNCMYRQHLQKHSKPHKCQLPGCPNKDGFARKDQLVRHQQNVKHDQPLPLPGARR
ncbi:hypothetical protein CLIM01_04892 [Colletotrichum limetticola]|uniref:C2H2-type domain-containing protein n=1 Tax=Colletotrichum limetticola TaxID=1209924 RepID=A0ABQ9Q1Q6_9PEZI|nr:hypothetical protein CLIM01_04892 [Colletotrichum limetticola]